MERVLALGDSDDAGIVGGKAASLSRLLGLGLRVPAGFVVVADIDTLAPLETQILKHFDALATQYVAVRSSAVNEDGASAVWAGQLNTYLNVGRDELVQHIRKCMQSNESERARAYAEQKKLAAGGVSVIVQAMVDSEISGVAFSAHPVTGDTEQLVIEAGLGLGEAIVSGAVTPDMYVLDKATGTTLETFVSSQTKLLKQSAGGATEWENIDPPASSQKLPAVHMAELASAVRTIERHYGFPVDVEWATAQDKLYILQARPITTLAAV